LSTNRINAFELGIVEIVR